MGPFGVKVDIRVSRLHPLNRTMSANVLENCRKRKNPFEMVFTGR